MVLSRTVHDGDEAVSSRGHGVLQNLDEGF
jgi:hypothetical protein